MAGYIFTLDNINSLSMIIENGVYSTNLKIPTNKVWGIPHEGTFADYFSMKEGDNVYFFHKRKIYGIGRLKNINGYCAFFNFPNADLVEVKDFNLIKNEMILNESEEKLANRFLCTFEAYPTFFPNGLDMDEVLSSNPNAFKMLRALWKLSFIKVDDIENKALFDYILKENEKFINKKQQKTYPLHEKIEKLDIHKYAINSKNILKSVAEGNYIKHEMAIEAAIIDYISNNSPNNIFGKWDYISHQVIASPFKPIDYMDKMDIFGYKYIEGFTTKSKYLMIEIKKDMASEVDIEQAMKYVDWIQQEYSNDYGMIEAYIVAKSFSQEVIEFKNSVAKRIFTKGSRPAKTEVWSNLILVEYNFNPQDSTLDFIIKR